jgi:hypothetical protein
MSIEPLAYQPDDDTRAKAQFQLWPRYVSHKIVAAAVIHGLGRPECGVGDSGVAILVKPYGDDRVERFYPSEPAMAARAEIGGYAVVYADGFCSVSPKEAFEAGYTPKDQPEVIGKG